MLAPVNSMAVEFDIHCQRCPRLAAHLTEIREIHPDYHAAPVPPFGCRNPRLLIVGLAPGLHGANASGRPFTGDFAGELLYRALFSYGWSNQPVSSSADDALELSECRITNAVKCLPPANRPAASEVHNCNRYLREEIICADQLKVVLALGHIAHSAVLEAMNLKRSAFKFAHNAVHPLAGRRFLVNSYHCSRYNLNTRRLTERMFLDVFDTVSRLAK